MWLAGIWGEIQCERKEESIEWRVWCIYMEMTLSKDKKSLTFEKTFLRTVLGSWQNLQEATEVSVLPASTHEEPPLLSISITREVYLSQLMNLSWHPNHLQSIVYLWLILDVVHSVGLDKILMTCTHGSRIIQSVFTALNILCVPFSFLFPVLYWI